MVLQTIHNLSDRETADAVTFDLRWKAACGFAVTETSFHPSVLTYWRRRLAASERPHRIFDAVAEVIALTGGCAGRKAVSRDRFDDATSEIVVAVETDLIKAPRVTNFSDIILTTQPTSRVNRPVRLPRQRGQAH